MAQIYEYQDIDAHVILLFVHPADILRFYLVDQHYFSIFPAEFATLYVKLAFRI